MKKFCLIIAFLAILVAPQWARAKKVHTIGDSTMATYEPERVTKGWGQMFQQFFTSDITVNNRAKGGASSKSFYKETPYWTSVKTQIQPGDYVLIQFAHNDEKNGGMDGDELIAYYNSVGNTSAASAADYRGTTPYDTYMKYLRLYVEETRALGATPILVAPICREYFNGNTIKRSGRHDLGDKFDKLTADGPTANNKVPTTDHTYDYPYHMRLVAEEMNVPFIDLTTATEQLYLSYGETMCNSLLFDGDGATHTSGMGATLIARICAQLLREQDILTEYINLTSEISVSPAKADFGKAYQGQSVIRDFYVSGFDLTPANGSVTVTAPEGILLSTDRTNYSSSITLSYEGGNLIGTFYARCTFSGNGEISGNITVTSGSQTIEIPVSGTSVVLDGGVDVSACWNLEKDDSCITEGPVTILGETYSGMKLQKYSAPNANTVWPEWTGFDASRKTQRNIIEGETWPAGEIDEVSTRYIDFGITPAAGATLDVDKISLFVCGCGGNGMRCKIYYSTNPDFADPVEMIYLNSMPANNMIYVEATPVIKLAETDQLHVRVYPWYDGGSTGKTICLSDVTIHGVSTEKASQAVPTDAYWKFNQGPTATPTTAELVNPELFSSSAWTLGSNLYISKTRNQNGVTLNNLQPRDGIAKGETGIAAANAAVFSIATKKGVTFQPTKLEFKSCKVGTGGGTWYIDIAVDGETTRIASSLDPLRDAVSECSYDLNIIPGQRVEVFFYVTNLANNKEIALSDVRLTGNLRGAAEDVPVYTLVTSTSDAEAGEVTVNPAGKEFDEGTRITVTASENFGYHFECWKDGDGKVVSTENPYTFAIESDLELVANYTHVNVYSLTVNIEGGANPYLVQYAPEGHVVDGVHHYEEGTEVTLTAVNNRILAFTNWEDNTTTATRDIKVNADTELTATFSCEDYIVGWDFYYDEPASQRAADFCAESENAGLLSLRNAEGGTMGWLAGGVNKGMQRGHYCARVWRPFSAGYYFEISFSTLGYSNILLSAFLGNDFPSYTVYDVEYSIDGKNFTKFAEYTLPNRGWTAGENPLPAEAENQPKVWIRFMADKSSGLTGSNAESATENTTDGFSIADVYVLAESSSASDDQAPVLVSSIPASGAVEIPSTGQIILTFDEKVVIADPNGGKLDGTPIEAVATGKTVAFKYAGLEYNTAHTFTLASGAITDRNGNPFGGVTISFTTLDRQQPEARLYDAIVAADGSGDYATVQEAIDNAPRDRAKPWLIFVKNGRYKGHVDIPVSKPFMHIIGQDRDKTVIADDRLSGGENAVHVSIGATVVVNSNDCLFENITLENTYGHERQDGPQALALNTIGDRTIFNNVAILSYQDTWITPSASANRAYVTNSLIEGAVDFIYNSGDIYIENTTLLITRKSGGYIVAPSHDLDVKWGYVFNNCTITAPGVPSETTVWLGRPWHNYPKTVFLNTRAEVSIPPTGWYETMGGLPVLWADYNTVDGNGNPVDLSNRRDTYYRVENGEKIYGKAKNYLNDEEAAQYTVKNVLSGTDTWQPLLKVEACDAPHALFLSDFTGITWEPVPYAICYVVCVDDQVIDITTDTTTHFAASRADASARYTVQAVNEYGGLSRATVVSEYVGAELTSADINAVDTIYYDLHGRRVINPAPGIYIRHNGLYAEKVMIK